jgi:AAA domain
MITAEKKDKVTTALNAWLEKGNPMRTGTYLKAVTGVNDTFISLIKQGKHELKGYPIADAHYLKIAREIGLELDEKFLWQTPNFIAIQQACKVAQQNQRRMIVDTATRQGKTFAFQFYATHNEKVIYIKCREAMRTKDLLLEMASRLALNLEGVRGEMAIMKAVMDQLTGENGWLIILDECEEKKNSLYSAIKEIEDFTRGITGLIIIGAGMIRKWRQAADRQRWIFPQLCGRFFVNRLELGTLTQSESAQRAKEAGITDKNVLTWFSKTVKDYDMLSQYLMDLRRITSSDMGSVDIQMINELFS